MKLKTFLPILLFIFSVPAVAQNEVIPQNISAQYKAEMEDIINKEYKNVIKSIDEDVHVAKNLRNKILKCGFNVEDYVKLALIPETNIPSSDLDLYAKLLKITQEKYLNKKYEPIKTDSPDSINEILTPYFKSNNINAGKLHKIVLYQNKKIEIVQKYIKEVEKLRSINN